ncbi:hypothetical protein P152DRAFT_315084 [Eremomyces bilateralis CBS 781.70]|uniref:GH16 domain-containing protein n=1 Tax=Eremomyces bilateralis CBS 781.70 TaxID=1392243 RepID=A0A6G1G629_9PEZI|nr:uncharacterized protein P152DRAFT_315084 [Eremomyces bilateralis CBS 781.70]KAF1813330.1 hypothetical protein P152DRAFT_315084 [Eremomyces bilateralis CBS 781.70]
MYSSSLLVSTLALALSAVPAVQSRHAPGLHPHRHLAPRETYPQWCLKDGYTGKDVFNYFNFFTGPDPTNGFVEYVDKETAEKEGLVKTIGDAAYFGVDSDTVLTGPSASQKLRRQQSVGRKSIRVQGIKTIDEGLVIVDVAHMPGAACGTWPALWTMGEGEWPKNGEIDIVEGINLNSANRMVLHTEAKCDISNADATGTLINPQCAVSAGTEGCAVEDQRPTSFGTGFNANGGGVYALLWTDDAIKMWFFPRGSVPSSITEKMPHPEEFGPPAANFEGDCDIPSAFGAQRLILNTDFCGDWAGNAWEASGCPMTPGLDQIYSCVKYVAENPLAFKES